MYCCRTTSIEGNQEATFTLIVNPQHEPVSPSSAHKHTSATSEASDILDRVITTTVSVTSDDQPLRSEMKTENHILIGGAIVGIVFASVSLLTLVSVYYRKRTFREMGSSNKKMYSYSCSGNRKDAQLSREARSMRIDDPETGLIIASLTSRDNPLFSMPALSLSNHENRLEVPFSALEFLDKLGNGIFGEVFKGTIRNLAYPHRQPKPCVIKLLKGNQVSTINFGHLHF